MFYQYFNRILILLFIFSSHLFSSELNTTIELTDKEKEFIKTHPTITLGGGASFEPFVILNDDGSVSGHDAEIANLISIRTGLNIEIKLDNWKKVQEKANKRELDGLISASYNREREKRFNHSNSYIKFTSLVIVKKNNPKQIYKLKDLEGKRVAIQKSNVLFENILKNSVKDVEIIYVEKIYDLLSAVVSNEVDFTILDETIFYLSKKLGLSGFIESAFTIGKPFDVMFWVRKDYPELVNIINKGLKSISEKEKLEIRDRWFSNTKMPKENLVKFTTKEQNYLKNKKEIKMCTDPDWLPFTKLENDKHIGISADIYKLISQKLPIPIKIIKSDNWAQSLEFGKERKCDIFDFAIETPNRKKYLNFTTPYLKIPLIIVTKHNIPFIANFKNLKDKRIGIVSGYAFIELLKKSYPNINIVEVKNISDGLQKVKDGELFGYVGALASVAHVFKREFTGELKISGRFNETLDMGSAVRNDEPILLEILQKAINSIEKQKIDNIVNKWIEIKYEKEFDYELFWKFISFALIILFFILYRQYELKKINQKLQQKVKNELEKSRKKDNLIFEQNKMVSLGEMIGNIAHQWRQPLAELAMSQNVIIGKMMNNLISEKEIIKKIKDEQKIVKFMSYTIDNFENFYKQDIDIREFYLYEAFEAVKFLLNETMNLSSIKIIKKIDKDIKYLGNINNLSQVILSIMQNSIYFLNSRDISKPQIIISIYKNNNLILLEIEDNAGGIDEKLISKIFDYNFSKRDNNKSSTGIGLYMSKLIIEEKFKGGIKVQNIQNGVKFTIYLQA